MGDLESLSARILAVGLGDPSPEQIESEFSDIVDALSPSPVNFDVRSEQFGPELFATIQPLTDSVFDQSVLRLGAGTSGSRGDWVVLSVFGGLDVPSQLLNLASPTDALQSLLVNRYAVPAVHRENWNGFVEHAHWTLHYSVRGKGIGGVLLGRLLALYDENRIDRIFLFTGYQSGRWVWPLAGFDFADPWTAAAVNSWFEECNLALKAELPINDQSAAYELATLGFQGHPIGELKVSLGELYEARTANSHLLNPRVAARFDQLPLIQNEARSNDVGFFEPIPFGKACLLYRSPVSIEGQFAPAERANYAMVLDLHTMPAAQRETLERFIAHSEQKFSQAFGEDLRSSDGPGGFTTNA